jgi:hypothetical protein
VVLACVRSETSLLLDEILAPAYRDIGYAVDAGESGVLVVSEKSPAELRKVTDEPIGHVVSIDLIAGEEERGRSTLQVFGRVADDTICEGERIWSPTMQ